MTTPDNLIPLLTASLAKARLEHGRKWARERLAEGDVRGALMGLLGAVDEGLARLEELRNPLETRTGPNLRVVREEGT